jgi:hypothetical protein
VSCPADLFACNDDTGRCILPKLLCDHQTDCINGRDEMDCPDFVECGEGNFTCDNKDCVPIAQRCDGDVNCSDRSDEIGCGRYCAVGTTGRSGPCRWAFSPSHFGPSLFQMIRGLHENLVRQIHAGFTSDARHIRESDANVACTCRAQQGMLLLDPSVYSLFRIYSVLAFRIVKVQFYHILYLSIQVRLLAMVLI